MSEKDFSIDLKSQTHIHIMDDDEGVYMSVWVPSAHITVAIPAAKAKELIAGLQKLIGEKQIA